MKQIIQDLKSGSTILEEIPVPKVKTGCVLIKTHRTLVSLGTERMLVEFGKASYISKARQQPEKVKMVLDKVKSDGLKPTMDAVFRKLGEPLPLGYCNAGEVVAVGKGVSEFQVGDRVISNGKHAEVVCVPKNLVAKIPEGVSYDEASFTVIGAIALQGIRLIKPTFGETIVVVGLGLIGQITARLLKANGCRVVGFDFDQAKVELAKNAGIEAFNVSGEVNSVSIVNELTGGTGTDGVVITASTKSNDVISEAANMSRKRGRIILVGVIGLHLQRADFYEKELSFQVSCSYGPGRYDEEYENKGNDYPIAYVRWTEKRNFEAVLRAMASDQLNVKPLISEIVELEDYQTIYSDMAGSTSIASILKYKADVDVSVSNIALDNRSFAGAKGVIGVIGAGNFAKSVIVPTLHKLNANVKYIASASGLTATTTAKKYKIANSTSDYKDMLKDDEVDAVIITTRHNSHASMVKEALEADKHVFVEKPLAITNQEIDDIITAYEKTDKTVTVGFNRRFSPFSIDARKKLGNSGSPISVIATMNAGFIPADHWVQSMEAGGGRIIGEACHLIDLITYFTGSLVDSVVMNAMGKNPEENTDNAVIMLKYKDGSLGVINYLANGNKAYAKERIEIYSQGRNIIIDNFRQSKFYGFSGSSLKKSQDKGHKNQFELLINNLKQGGGPTIPFDEVINTSRASIAAVESLKQGKWIDVR